MRPSESYDAIHANKPWVLKHDGVVYHWYCAVSRRNGREVRGIALAMSKPPTNHDIEDGLSRHSRIRRLSQ